MSVKIFRLNLVIRVFFLVITLLVIVSCNKVEYSSLNESEQLTLKGTNVLKKTKNYTLQFSVDGNTYIYFGNEVLTDGSALITELDESISNVAWVETYNSNSVSDVVVNGVTITNSDSFNNSLFFHNETLYWLSSNSSSVNLCSYLKTTFCISLDFIPKQAFNINDIVYVIGFDSRDKMFLLCSYTNLLNFESCERSNSTFFYINNNDYKTVYSLVSDRINNSDVYALSWFLGTQRGDPYVYSNDFKGRVTNNLTYRFSAISSFYENTKQTWVKNYLLNIVNVFLDNLGDDYLFYSKKYTISKSSLEPFAVDNALIWNSLLDASVHFPEKVSSTILDKAVNVYQFYEKYWNHHSREYRFSNNPDVDFDGIFLPLNQQAAMGLLALKLYVRSNNSIYLERASDIFDIFRNEIDVVEGVKLFRYWPKKFYEGWSYGDYVSKNRPFMPASVDFLYDDYLHADLVIDFLNFYSAISGEDNLVDVDLIIDNLRVTPVSYSFFTSGDFSILKDSWNFFPLNNLADVSYDDNWFLRNELITRNPEFDNQLVFLTYAKNIRSNRGYVVFKPIVSNAQDLIDVKFYDDGQSDFISSLYSFFRG